MNWKSEAIEKLKQYNAKKESLQIIPKQIADIDSNMGNIHGINFDHLVSKSNSGAKREDWLLNSIVQKEELQKNLESVKQWIAFVDQGLSVLTQEERRILECFFILDEPGAAQKLATEFYIDIKTVYHRKDRALRKFTIAMYGFVET